MVTALTFLLLLIQSSRACARRTKSHEWGMRRARRARRPIPRPRSRVRTHARTYLEVEVSQECAESPLLELVEVPPELVQVHVHPLQVPPLLGHLAEVVGKLQLGLKKKRWERS